MDEGKGRRLHPKLLIFWNQLVLVVNPFLEGLRQGLIQHGPIDRFEEVGGEAASRSNRSLESRGSGSKIGFPT